MTKLALDALRQRRLDEVVMSRRQLFEVIYSDPEVARVIAIRRLQGL